MTDIRVAFSTLACPGWSADRLLEAASDLGYDGLELRLLNGEVIDPVHDRKLVERVVADCRAGGLEVCALDTSCRLNAALPVEREALSAALPAWIELARAARVPLLRLFGGQTSPAAGPSDAVAEDGRVLDALHWAAPLAEASGVTLLLETHDAFSSARRVAGVLDQIPSAAVGALWDSHHPYRMGETAAEVMACLGPRIKHVHLKDARRLPAADDAWQLVPLGEGHIPVREQVLALARAGYRGWLSLEWEKKWHGELAEPEETLPRQLTWLRHALADAEAGT